MKENGVSVQNRILVGNGTPADVRYFDPLFGSRLRSKARMPIEGHRECSRLLHQVARETEGRRGASEPVKFVCNTLDSWAMEENDRDELDMETLGGLYCPGPRLGPEERVGPPALIEWLERVKGILVTHYPHGKALRELLRELDRAIASIRKWNGKPQGKVYREPVLRNGTRPGRRA